ncbi:unnamed protein product [Didymodactylos carnosus]|uniref:Uncharacterized protein n=1 Tax=Didymodactylos carnosus TaxID=1234261 RepID=A0A814YC97_9BILA|nr:unnamed protein product [Didymodactylos carnosus]CAF1303731.1 unnamed protein product [Didymodactylos carnosus]CAF3991160.1 unnamed protein product [Didymodactylos carnosus]CAF4110505.1 unnamed protein product [Didymodactylos carnosus]
MYVPGEHELDIIDEIGDESDLNTLRRLLMNCRQELFKVIEQMIRNEISYENVVMKSDYDDLSLKHEEISREYDKLKIEFKDLGHSCLFLVQKTKDLVDERDKYYDDWEKNRSILTPRPDWDKCSNVLDGGMDRWKKISAGKTSDQLVEILISEIIDGNQTTHETMKQNYFDALGEEKQILPFLRSAKNKKIKNRHMRRRITGLLIKEIWNEQITKGSSTAESKKIAIDDDSSFDGSDQPLRQPVLTDLANVVFDYLKKRFDSKDMAIEIGYNLRDACLRYRNSERINLFWGILTGQIEEQVFHYQMKTIAQLLQHLCRMKIVFEFDETTMGTPGGTDSLGLSVDDSLHVARLQSIRNSTLMGGNSLASASFGISVSRSITSARNSIHELVMSRNQFLMSLKLLYPTKTSEKINELVKAAERDLHMTNMQTFEFGLLFMEGDDGKLGNFLSTLLKQLNEEKIQYVDSIKLILMGHPLVPVSQFKRAITMVDSTIPQAELKRYVEWVYNTKIFNEKIKPLDFEDLLRRLENCACYKH